jgi:hypothetical protein
MKKTKKLEKTPEIQTRPANSRLDGWRLINSGFKKKAYRGVGLLMSPEVKLVVEQGRILRARIVHRGIKMVIHVALFWLALFGNVISEKSHPFFYTQKSRNF